MGPYSPISHLPSRRDPKANVGDGFTDDVARPRDIALTDCNEQNHRFTELGRIYGRTTFSSLNDHVGRPQLSVETENPPSQDFSPAFLASCFARNCRSRRLEFLYTFAQFRNLPFRLVFGDG